jgi:hypothetical protein
MTHIYPLNDEREHELDGEMCWCEPTVLWTDPKTDTIFGDALAIHNAADCREIVEEAEQILREL